MVKKILFTLFCILNLSLSGQEIFKLGQTGIKSTEGLLFYSLPRTNVLVKVVCTRTSHFAGPYFAYAEEMLGIKGLPSEDKTEWRIDSVFIQAVQESDPEATFAFRPDKNFNPEKFFVFSNAGLIFNPLSYLAYPELNNIMDTGAPKVKFDDFVFQSIANSSFDTIYKTIVKDTMYVKVPVVKPKTAPKTLRDKARDAADAIMRIRERRFELLMSEDDPYAEYNVLKFALNELEKIESNYLELFTGKKVEKSYTYWFQHNPDNKDLNFELFRFSSSVGVADKSVSTASPVILSYEKEGKLKPVRDWLTNIPESNNKILYYRIPESAIVKVTYKGQVIAFKKVSIGQYGLIMPYSIKNN